MRPHPVPEHKVLITGTGRCGTTFLVELLTELGLDTGINRRNRDRKYYEHCNAGLEHNLLDPKTPYIVKNPALCTTLAQALATGRFTIDHVYIPVRELGQAAASRIDVGGADGSVPGGLWGTSDPAAQASVLARDFFCLVHTLAEHEIAHTFLGFPRLVRDPAYLHRKLQPLLGGIEETFFMEAFTRVAAPSLVHDFRPGAPRIERAPQARTKRRWRFLEAYRFLRR